MVRSITRPDLRASLVLNPQRYNTLHLKKRSRWRAKGSRRRCSTRVLCHSPPDLATAQPGPAVPTKPGQKEREREERKRATFACSQPLGAALLFLRRPQVATKGFGLGGFDYNADFLSVSPRHSQLRLVARHDDD